MHDSCPYENWQPDRARNRPVSGHNPISLACLERDRTRHQFCIAVMCKRDICLAQLSAKTQPERTRQMLLPVASRLATQRDICLAQVSAETQPEWTRQIGFWGRFALPLSETFFSLGYRRKHSQNERDSDTCVDSFHSWLGCKKLLWQRDWFFFIIFCGKAKIIWLEATNRPSLVSLR